MTDDFVIINKLQFAHAYLLCYSPALTASLKDLATQIPQLKKDIQDGLLHMLSLILMRKPLKHPGAPKSSHTSLPQSSAFPSVLY